MKRIYLAKNFIEANLLKGLLDGENIEAEVLGKYSSEIGHHIPSYDTCPSVWVMNDQDYDRAMELVSTFNQGEHSDLEDTRTWHCRCGEENEYQFSECWSCGRTRQKR